MGMGGHLCEKTAEMLKGNTKHLNKRVMGQEKGKDTHVFGSICWKNGQLLPKKTRQ